MMMQTASCFARQFTTMRPDLDHVRAWLLGGLRPENPRAVPGLSFGLGQGATHKPYGLSLTWYFARECLQSRLHLLAEQEAM